MQVIVLAALALVVLIILVLIVTGQSGRFIGTLNKCKGQCLGDPCPVGWQYAGKGDCSGNDVCCVQERTYLPDPNRPNP